MLSNYFKIAWRNLVKNKVYTFINVFGLAIGIATCLIITLFVQDELSFDRFHDKADRIVRIVFRANINGGKIDEATVMPPTAKTLKNDYAEVETSTRLRSFGMTKVKVGNQAFTDNSMAFVDDNFFEVFSLPFLKGDSKTALIQPNTMVISENLAAKYFGNENPIDKLLYFSKSAESPPFKITGVFKDIPANTHFHFDMLGSMISDKDASSPSWMQSNYFTYLVLQKGYDYKQLEAKLPQMVEKYMGPEILQAKGISLAQFRAKGNKLGFQLQKLTDIHFNSKSADELEPGSDIKYVYIFGAIALFMLLIACINFMNLSTASASNRAKEVGIRKVLGSIKLDLVKQFLLESILLSCISMVFAVILMQLFLPIFNNLADKNLSLGLIEKPFIILAILVFGLLVGVLAGSYPAFFLSEFKPIDVMKGGLSTAKNSSGLRSSLVVFQFCISICMIVGTTIVYQQLAYIQNKNLGFEKEQLIVLPNSWALGKNEAVFKQQLLNDSRVVNVTTSAYKPAGPTNSNNSLAYPEGNENQLMRTLQYSIDAQYIPTMGMKIVAGRNFSEKFGNDSSGIIINEAAAKVFGWQKNAVGHQIARIIDNNNTKKIYTIIGVVKDFHFKSLHETISPLLMVNEPGSGLIIKTRNKDTAGLLVSMKSQWAKYQTGEAFTYAFMDELVNKTYISEQKTGKILEIFAGLTIFIACLGLFGLATFTANQRTKEIGIRKVLGASIGQMIGLLSIDFIKLVLISCVFAFPLGWFAMSKWLDDFAYRIDISWWTFGLAGISALSIALLTISYQAIRAAMMNPVKSLKTE